jgi:hypothetical protein
MVSLFGAGRAGGRARRGGGDVPAALLLALFLLAPAAALAAATPPPSADADLALHVYQMRHQSARDAMNLVLPLLSSRGTVELRPGGNTLVVKDTLGSLQRILPALYAFDHPAAAVELEIWLVRANGVAGVSPQMPVPPNTVPAELLKSLRNNFAYQSYQLLGSSRVRALEGERVTFQVAKDFSVRFRLGTIVGGQRLRLNDFEVLLEPETGEPVPVLRSQLNLWLERPLAFGMTAGQESGTALLVVVRVAGAAPPAKGKG